ncbi:tetratricopeptide repeat-containing diguanylate cyclase [Anaerorhabdus sp.]|uniref:tetratricopeptide repeat-containing diguanylate cyclase n=1 Tax=Anaerorhabdus sp. TaxID=1872524 RepID=UPI002FCADA32
MKTLAQIELDMSEILRVRYSNPEQEKLLCLELLEWEEKNTNSYVCAFAHTYLGDYYVGCAVGESEQCIPHLMKAHEISSDNSYNDLLVRIYNTLGFYYNSIADDQSALKYYIEGISVCHQVKDVINEALILNNIGYNLQRSHGYDQALSFYKDAYNLLQNHSEPSPIKKILLNNLATVCILINQIEEAKNYIMLCEKEYPSREQYDLYQIQNWCQYYSAIKDHEKALSWANQILLIEQNETEENPDSFDIYAFLFDSMIELQNREYASKFLSLMEKHAKRNSFNQCQSLELRNMKFNLTFEKDELCINNAYKRYAQELLALDQVRNATITNGLKDAINYLSVIKQKEALHSEKKNLDVEINIDELTKVYTRHYLEMIIEKFDKQTSKTLAFIMIDVDCLKEYNDTYGHINGDYVLHYVGSLLNIYKNDHIYPCRFGGDEFVCLCINNTDEQIEEYIKNIRKDLHERNIPHNTSRCAKEITLSIGYSNVSEHINLQEIFELADQALYQSKQNGRNTYTKIVA